MPKVISNTTPIISLGKIGHLNLLQKVFGEIIVPAAVHAELVKGKGKQYFTDISLLSWMKILPVNKPQALDNYPELDAGEAKAIVLALEQEADLVLIDETMGRRVAKRVQVKVSGTIGVLVKAKGLGLIKKVGPLLDEMQQKGIWINSTLKEKIIEMAGEKFFTTGF